MCWKSDTATLVECESCINREVWVRSMHGVDWVGRRRFGGGTIHVTIGPKGEVVDTWREDRCDWNSGVDVVILVSLASRVRAYTSLVLYTMMYGGVDVFLELFEESFWEAFCDGVEDANFGGSFLLIVVNIGNDMSFNRYDKNDGLDDSNMNVFEASDVTQNSIIFNSRGWSIMRRFKGG